MRKCRVAEIQLGAYLSKEEAADGNASASVDKGRVRIMASHAKTSNASADTDARKQLLVPYRIVLAARDCTSMEFVVK